MWARRARRGSEAPGLRPLRRVSGETGKPRVRPCHPPFQSGTVRDPGWLRLCGVGTVPPRCAPLDAAALRNNSPAMIPNEPRITPELVAEHGLKPEEYQRILDLIGREPSLTELGIFSAMWNEHCSYKSSKVHLKTPADQGALGDPGAGRERRRHRHRRRPCGRVQDGEPQPPELHRALPGRGDRGRRHPARRVHHGGAADRLPQRALASATRRIRRPGTSSPAWSPASAATATRSACRRSAARCASTPRYDGNCLVNAMAVGLAETDKIFYAAASGVGMPIVYLGSKTGRDGIHGASMASAEFDEDSEGKRPTVQVGDPFSEKLLLEACLEIMAKDCVIAIQDMGAAGPHLLGGRDGRQGRPRRHARPRPGAVPRDRHERLRDDAVGEPGAHAHGAQAREGAGGRGDLPQMGARLRGGGRDHADAALHRAPPRRRHGRPADQGTGRRGAGVRSAVRRDAEAAGDRTAPKSRRRSRSPTRWKS